MSENEIAPEPSRASARAGMRASDADRERLATELRDHAVAGRLDTDELETRVQQAYAARTTDELRDLRRDLPATPEALALAHRERRARLVRRTLQETGGSLGLFVVCTAIWLAGGAHGSFWPVWVLLVFALSAVRNGWDLFGPGADLDAVEARLDARRRRRQCDADDPRDARRARRADRRARRLDR
jgi:hypothetical protein